MSTGETIEAKLREALSPSHLEVHNESGMHNVPAGSETHFKVVVVSEAFEGQSPVARHRKVYALLDAELKAGVHALSVQAHTPSQWADRPEAHASPPCLGGSKAG